MKLKCFLAVVLMLTAFHGFAKASIPIFYSLGTDIEKVQRVSEWKVDNQPADLGIMHGQFSVFGIPLWNYGTEKYVLFKTEARSDWRSKDFTYAELSASELASIRKLYPSIPAEPELPFWDRVGGKLVVLGLIGGYLLISNLGSGSSEE